MARVTDNYEKWMNTPVFHCPTGDRHAYLQLVHMKCFAVTVMNSCVMNILVVNAIQLYLTGLLGVCALMALLSPHQVGKIIPIIFIIFAFTIRFVRGNINFRFGTFYLYCLLCCMEVQGFEFLFDLYLIVCYVFEAVYAFYAKRHFNVLSTVICEFGMWTIQCSAKFRLAATFGYLAIEAYNYPQIWAVSTFYVSVSGYMFISHMHGVDLEAQLEQLRNAVGFLYELFVANATFAVVPERKFYKS
ncbi:unnamed protein product [Larinioides sclopetarius]|uniref:Uncharacterized protein n=1 Tax=Larinioides sclopetarius TaxID=280406 RepID=A0AAV2A344_9ARAC